ncbi:MAG: efflux RND transporter periplasmic adaptor subunit [Flavobacteriaceae bacterium]|nr:efflux RND transporter periplasmic adaptor subunit [Flavobacteriaceae bacterium]
MKNSIILIALLTLAACGGGNGEDPKLTAKKKKLDELKKEVATLEKEIAEMDTTANKEDKLKIVAVTDVVMQSFRHFIDIQGRVDADENITVMPKMPGTVTAVYVQTGDMVKAGQTLAQLDDKAARQGMEELKNRLDLANTIYQKQKGLWDQKIGSEINFLMAKNNKDALEKSMSTFNENIEMYKLKALINGVVDDMNLRVGQMASPGFTGIRIVNGSKLKLKADVAEAYASKVKQGNSVVIQFPDLGTQLNSNVTYASKVINPMTRTFTVEAALPQNDDYRPNMVAVLKIVDYENVNTIVVPINTVQSNDEGSFVFVLASEGNKHSVRRRPVTTGLNYGGKIEIKTGLKLDDQLVSTGYQELNEGEVVKVSK